MGRKRSHAHPLPAYVAIKRNHYILRQYIKQSDRGQIETDKFGYAKPVNLGHKDTPIHLIYSAYGAAMEQMKFEKEEQFLSLKWLYKEYSKNKLFIDLQPSTQKRYVGCSRVLEQPLKINGIESTLGDLRANYLSRVQLRKILDKRFFDYQIAGKKGGAQVNNEMTLISAMFRYAGQYVEELSDITNPTKGISKYNVAIRERHVTDEQYKVQYEIAEQYSQPYLPIAMELTFLLAARGMEVHRLKIGHAMSEGIIVFRRKGSKTTIVRTTKKGMGYRISTTRQPKADR